MMGLRIAQEWSAMSDPTSFDELYPGRFMKAGLFKGRPVTLTIKRVYREKLMGESGEEGKSIIAFVERDLELVLCKTNGLCLRAMFGTHIPDWIGKRVTLYPSRDKSGENWFGNDEAIRVKGSPDIERNMSVEIRRPRRKPRTVTLERTGATERPREPGEDG